MLQQGYLGMGVGTEELVPFWKFAYVAVRETLPEGFQRSEFLLEHGALDMIVDRRDMRDRVGGMLRLLMKQQPVPAAAAAAA